MKNRWNLSVMRWMVPLTIVGLGGCPLDSETVGKEQDGGGSSESEESSGGSSESESAESSGSASAESTESSSATGTVDATEGESGGFEVDCADPTPILQADGVTPSGLVTCSDGFVHRAESVACVLPAAPTECSSDQDDACTSSAECTDAPNGACVDVPGVLDGCGCVYGCETDADCGAEEICLCTGGAQDWPRCVPVDCETDADCGGGLCGFDAEDNGCGQVEYLLACLQVDSECRDVCPEELTCFDELAVPPCSIVDGQWACDIDDLCEDCG